MQELGADALDPVAAVSGDAVRRPLDAHQAGFATGEVIAHINYMLSRGELVKEIQADGVMRFRAA